MLIARMQQDHAVKYYRGVAVVGELIKTECLKPAAGYAL